MHMADALLSPAVGGTLYAVSGAAAALAAAKIKNGELGEKKLPLMAVSGAFVFAAQMINFAIPGTGSSGHIGGGILLAGLLGGYPALLTLAAVLTIQCLFFADGGLLALGANIFNMGVVPCLIVYPLLFRPLLKKGITPGRLSAASILSAIAGLGLGAFGVVAETMASGVAELPFAAFAGLMLPIHLVIGAVEGVITAAVLTYVCKTRPELLQSALDRAPVRAGVSVKKTVAALAVCAVLAGGGLSFYASQNPDGLEWAMGRILQGRELRADDAAHTAAAAVQQHTAILPDYDTAKGGGGATGAAGVTGALLTCALAGGAGAAVTLTKKRAKKRRDDESRQNPGRE